MNDRIRAGLGRCAGAISIQEARLEVEPVTLLRGSRGFPADALNDLGERAPAVITGLGNVEILQTKKLGFFCSARCPGKLILAVHDFCQELKGQGVTVIGGFHSPVERECLNILLRGTGPIIICPARGLKGMRIPALVKVAMDQGRILYLSPFEDRQRRATAKMAAYRNLFVAALVDSIFVGYAHPGSKTEELCREARFWEKPVFGLDSDTSASLFGLGRGSVGANPSAK